MFGAGLFRLNVLQMIELYPFQNECFATALASLPVVHTTIRKFSVSLVVFSNIQLRLIVIPRPTPVVRVLQEEKSKRNPKRFFVQVNVSVVITHSICCSICSYFSSDPLLSKELVSARTAGDLNLVSVRLHDSHVFTSLAFASVQACYFFSILF